MLTAVKDKPCGRPQKGPSLTATALAGRTVVRAGREEWLRTGPNKKNAPRQEDQLPRDMS